MAGQGNAAPVIIKRKKVIAGGGHHGGAWKVAYADFVTAMMAFFMLMWLLNATTEKQRKGIADYFSPTIPVNRISGGGEGAFGGDSVFSERTMAQNGTGASNANPTEGRQAQGQTGIAESDRPEEGAASEKELKELEAALLGKGGESPLLDQVLQHVVTRVTDEGLIVEIFDLPDAPLFVGDTDAPTQVLRDLAVMIAEVFGLVKNGVAVNGHVRNYPIVLVDNPVWDLSTARAQQTRQLLETAELPAARFKRVTGMADRQPVVTNQMAGRNNRIELILLRSDIRE